MHGGMHDRAAGGEIVGGRAGRCRDNEAVGVEPGDEFASHADGELDDPRERASGDRHVIQRVSEGLTLEQMLEILSDAVTATPWLKGKLPVLKGQPSDITLDIRTTRKDVMSAIATGARNNGVAMPATSGALASLSAAVAGGWGDKDLAEVPRFFRDFMLQDYE